MADIDPFSYLVHCSFCFLVNCSNDFFYFFFVFCINFESFKLTMNLKILIVVVLISTLILFFHIWYVIIISLFCDERKVHLGIRSTHHQLGLELTFGTRRDGTGIGLLMLLLMGMGTNQPAPTQVCVGDEK